MFRKWAVIKAERSNTVITQNKNPKQLCHNRLHFTQKLLYIHKSKCSHLLQNNVFHLKPNIKKYATASISQECLHQAVSCSHTQKHKQTKKETFKTSSMSTETSTENWENILVWILQKTDFLQPFEWQKGLPAANLYLKNLTSYSAELLLLQMHDSVFCFYMKCDTYNCLREKHTNKCVKTET